jgi:tyrosinase
LCTVVTTTAQVLVQPAPVPAQVKLRQSVSQMAAGDLARYRNAVSAILARPDNRGFGYFANWHGVAFGLCQHHDDLFLPWHRGYVYHLELALQDVDPQVSIPWWNWIDEPGLPAAFDDPQADGGANVLHDAPVTPYGVQPQPDWPQRTTRDPGAAQPPGVPAPWPPPLRTTTIGGQQVDLYDWMMSSPSYAQFEQRCWRLHDNVHVWVGGTMADQNWAAFDPIFFSHHAMVDRLWRIWQHNNPNALPDASVLDASMTFATSPSLKVSDVLDVTALGYDYAAQTASTPGTT